MLNTLSSRTGSLSTWFPFHTSESTQHSCDLGDLPSPIRICWTIFSLTCILLFPQLIQFVKSICWPSDTHLICESKKNTLYSITELWKYLSEGTGKFWCNTIRYSCLVSTVALITLPSTVLSTIYVHTVANYFKSYTLNFILTGVTKSLTETKTWLKGMNIKPEK